MTQRQKAKDETYSSLNIISASRRTDIPGFYTPWLLNRLRAGFVRYRNPFNGAVSTLSLRPEDVHSIVFWSKHYATLLPHLDELRKQGYHFYFHYTITGAPRVLEPHVPDWQQAVRVFRELARRTGSHHVQWRFDPIVLTDELDATFYLQRFRDIASALAGATRRCYFSFVIHYDKVKRRFQQAAINPREPSLDQRQALVRTLADVAEEYGITLYSCCEDDLVGNKVQKAHCIDGDLLAELFPERPVTAKLNPTREQCGCLASRDIGVYDTCPFGCVYCYANQSHSTALTRFRSHNPDSDMLAA